MRATQMTGQLARFYGLPLRSSGVCAANVPDGQAMWETSNSLWAAVQSGSNMVYHAAGWLEGGLIASPEKFIMDCEVLQQIQRYFEPATYATGDGGLALEAIREVGSTGAFLRHPAYPGALRDGVLPAVPVATGATTRAGAWPAGSGPPSARTGCSRTSSAPSSRRRWIDAIREELEAFVARRKAEGGAPTDF